MITLGRWLATNAIIVYLRDYYASQIMILLVMSVASQAMIISAQPYEAKKDN
jgi:hypothetical protein